MWIARQDCWFCEKYRIESRTGKFTPTKALLRINFASNKLWLWAGVNLPVHDSIRDFSWYPQSWLAIQIGPEVGPTQEKGKNSPKIGKTLFLGYSLSNFLGGTQFRTHFVSYFRPQAQNLFFSRLSGLDILTSLWLRRGLKSKIRYFSKTVQDFQKNSRGTVGNIIASWPSSTKYSGAINHHWSDNLSVNSPALILSDPGHRTIPKTGPIPFWDRSLFGAKIFASTWGTFFCKKWVAKMLDFEGVVLNPMCNWKFALLSFNGQHQFCTILVQKHIVVVTLEFTILPLFDLPVLLHLGDCWCGMQMLGRKCRCWGQIFCSWCGAKEEMEWERISLHHCSCSWC